MNINNQTLSSPGIAGPISEKLLQYRPPRMVMFFLIINQVFCPFEEKKMDETFCEEYFSYRRKVRRWV